MAYAKSMLFIFVLAAGLNPASPTRGSPSSDPTLMELRASVERMKNRPRGPFSRIRWFCVDGAILPPRPYACSTHGGGVQRGEWSAETRQLRALGYPIATPYVDIKTWDLIAPDNDPDRIQTLLLEQFLIRHDNGWVLRQARFYRGAFQAEDEARSARGMLLDLAGVERWRNRDYLLFREMVRLFPHNQDSALLTEVRGLSSLLAKKDPKFVGLRNKIHVRPDAQDARRVRRYAASLLPVQRGEDYEQLSSQLDQAFQQPPPKERLRQLVAQITSAPLRQVLLQTVQRLPTLTSPSERLALSARLLAELRVALPDETAGEAVFAAVRTSLFLEHSVFRAASELVQQLQGTTRAQRLQWLYHSAQALFGSGFLTAREWLAVQQNFDRLDTQQTSLATYREALHYLERLPGWAQRRLRFYFGPAVEQLAQIEPLARQFVPDRLRGSPMLFYAQLLDTLVQDAQRLSQVHHQVFGKPVASGLRVLNPGLARGVISTADDIRGLSPTHLGNRLYVTSATTADLPPVAGILTASEGNELSHVQLLARNLGIPNVVVSPQLLEQILGYRGRSAVLAASPGGVVRLEKDAATWDRFFRRRGSSPPDTRLRPNIGKLDLTQQLIPLDQLRASDSGRRVGPKASQLGELSWHYPRQVSPGLVIPFGYFHAALERPLAPGAPPARVWLHQQYQQLERLQGEPEAYAQHLSQFLNRIRAGLKGLRFDEAFRTQLKEALHQQFGPEGSYGVFVRSDTNVEDLPGFSGAGLNRTVPNVVGFEAILDGIKSVWASAFTERAFAWRQLRMDSPDLVYVSVLLHKSVAVAKSGVMVTADLESGRLGVLSVAINEGVGGGVEGQAAESLRIDLADGAVRLLASATASRQRQLVVQGGSRLVPARGPEQLLTAEEMALLTGLVKGLPDRYRLAKDDNGRPLPADIEFGFIDGRLMLFQIRPFLHSPQASRSEFLSALDSPLAQGAQQWVMLAEAPPKADR